YYKLGGEAYGVTGNTTHLYVADLQKGVYILNITDPSHLIEISEYSNAAPHDIFWNDNEIFLADQDKGLIILDEHLEPLYAGFPRDLSLQLFLIGATLVVGLILPVYWYRRHKE
ncbi:MAG: hypothetical protein ACW991_10710, partial [Candidatus Hodarchaeales archaeon]